MLMLKTTHDRIVAADTKKLGEQVKLIEKLAAERDQTKATSAKLFGANLRLTRELANANARLARFTSPRERGPGGRFLPVKSPIDHVIAALEAM